MVKRALDLPGREKPYLMAHRGNRVRCPENTLAAFRWALAEGADILETDLHLSVDGELVCIHDATLDRTTDGEGPVAAKTLRELKALSASCDRSEFADERIPTLGEVTAILPTGIALALELKTSRFLEPAVGRQLVHQLRTTGVFDRTVLLSFHLDYLKSVQREAPDLPIGQISMTSPFPRKGVQLNGLFWPALLLNPFYARAAHRYGQATCPLDPTPDSRLKWYRWMGFDAILSDDPGTTLAKMREIGWRS
ncbi:MAG: glycerophosphodiester phosphodiesterase [Bellilinea sp.]